MSTHKRVFSWRR